MTELPIEILFHILSFIPTDELNNVMLVNSDFYAYCSKKLSFKHLLVINKEKLNDRFIVDSMSHSLRRFKRLTISLDNYDCEHLKSLQAILENIGSCVLILDLNTDGRSKVEIKQSVLVSWLNMMKNLKEVLFDGFFPITCKEIIDDPSTELNLPNVIFVRLCPLGLGLKLHQMAKSSIQHLILNDKISLPNIEEIFIIHRETLHTLELSMPVYSDPKPFRHLRLIEFACRYHLYMHNPIHTGFLMEIIEHQNILAILELGFDGDKDYNCYPVNSELLNVICNKTQLEDISIGLHPDVTPNDIYQLRKLKNLKRILLQTTFNNFDVGLDVLQAFAITKIPSLKILNLQANIEDVTEQTIQSIGESFPNLEEFSGDYNSNDMENELGLFNVFLSAFPNLTSLFLKESHYEFFPGLIYTKMKRIYCFNFDGEINICPWFIKSMPNLDDLYVASMTANYATLVAILESKITKIDIKISPDLSDDELKMFREIFSLIKGIKGDDCLIEFLASEEDSQP